MVYPFLISKKKSYHLYRHPTTSQSSLKKVHFYHFLISNSSYLIIISKNDTDSGHTRLLSKDVSGLTYNILVLQPTKQQKGLNNNPGHTRLQYNDISGFPHIILHKPNCRKGLREVCGSVCGREAGVERMH